MSADQNHTFSIAKSDASKVSVYSRMEGAPPARVTIENSGPEQIRVFWGGSDWHIPADTATVFDLSGAGTMTARVDATDGTAKFDAIIQTLSTHS